MENNYNNNELKKICDYLISIYSKGIKKEDEDIDLICRLLDISKENVHAILKFLSNEKAIIFKNSLGSNWIINVDKCNHIIKSSPKN